MQILAKETNLSETAFVLKSERAHFRARYFTPAEEIPLAGHPTLSTVHALLEDGQIQLSNSKSTTLTLELRAGVIEVEIRSLTNGGTQIVMRQNQPLFMSKHDPQTIAELFHMKSDDFISNVPIQTVSTGTPQLMVPIKSHEALRRAAMDVEKYRAYKAQSDFFSPHLFCLTGATSQGQTFARHFGLPPDTVEDAFTGSATGGMAAYLWHHGLIDSSSFIAEQGHWMGRPGKAWVEVLGSRDDIQAVKVGGQVVTIFTGVM